MGAAIVGLAALVLLLWALAPLTSRPAANGTIDTGEIDDLVEQKRTALNALIDIENEIAVAKLTPHDAASLRTTYEREALEAIDRLEVVSQHAPLEDELEAEIAAARERLRCPDCGTPRKNNDVCANCGRKFVEPGL